MNYEGLQQAYWQSQALRVETLRAKINARAAAPSGRVIPDDEDLVLGEGRRLKAAVMFLDISSFSQRASETADQQDIMLRVLNLFFTEMMKIAEDYGGTVEKNTGDGLMAYFEDAGGETGTKRALSCALTMMAANDLLLRPIFLATPVDPIKFRVSIDRGFITVARLGAARRFNANVAIGATANFAAKMLSHANPGDVVLGDLALKDLPLSWQLQYGQLATTETGWHYVSSGKPYPLYRYTGRWARLS
jgi:adenylate cyclase